MEDKKVAANGRQALHRLIWGIVEFREHQLPKYAERFRDLALAQSPDTLMVTCSDSRVVPDLLASTDPGDLFTMRNVGNLIPPATADGISIGDVSEASAIDTPCKFWVCIVVCGIPNVVLKAVLAQPGTRRISKNGCITPALRHSGSNTRAR
jgi:hypothetical protein